ncbi:riboflavin synthase, alpha subunit [Thermoanaerobacter mathranii subsp. mathranii str. A3]|jgi:riboflavin synthase|uniref:Riboflavin synthase n=1 Tax=Thermoanaerobacter mathranii subsp. mathranii (strain DSM 11426 / CCUG 53645 / CIP 108742 / A3) TaxID=583358 RepID=A0ABN3Z198_THEM3|nr:MULTISPECIES: riboflavin synthase [Thermoanaerobacter]ABY91345.1 riboflavin synthase, alpha subunit [Thermoanaerobacter sp. X514]ADH59826.1 riboflavin synthase, alpha subunit [Thermoanaerobacter mathranii subsp. mathranii str. A3]MBT1279409.1 riboflavin synthase [Thermoanaerobacter sp. CM-CNRG TB177]
MFTGIIEETGTVKNITHGTFTKIVIKCSKVLEETKIGDSIAVNGVCLTVTNISDESFAADVMPETMRASNLKDLKTGSIVNLERALQVGRRMGGHIVTGHIDCVGKIIEKRQEKNAFIFKIAINEKFTKYIARKGSIAVDGISLTVVEDGYDYFTVSVIPHTMLKTTLGYKGVGDSVNIEVDILSKYVEKLIGKKDIKDLLKENGFI